MLFIHRSLALIAGGVILSGGMAAQQRAAPPALTTADYSRAERFMAYNTTPLIRHSGVRAIWISDDRFWYRVNGQNGQEAWLVDAATLLKSPCTLDPCQTPAPTGPSATPARTDVLSPDKTKSAFIRDWNLWTREVATGNETPLTHDGARDFGYATDNAGWTRSDRPILMWSPDSRKIATYQQDQRGVAEMHLVDDGLAVGHEQGIEQATTCGVGKRLEHGIGVVHPVDDM